MISSEAIIDPINALKGLFSGIVSNIIVSLIIFFVGFIIGKMLGKITTKILHQLNVDFIIKKILGIKISIEDIIGACVTYFIYFISLIMALNQIGLTTTMFMIIFTAIIILIVISIILSIKDFIPNFISGLIIREKSFIKEGDVIEVKDICGKVKAIDLLETKIENKHGDLIFIPNSILTKHEIINYQSRKKLNKNSK